LSLNAWQTGDNTLFIPGAVALDDIADRMIVYLRIFGGQGSWVVEPEGVRIFMQNGNHVVRVCYIGVTGGNMVAREGGAGQTGYKISLRFPDIKLCLVRDEGVVNTDAREVAGILCSLIFKE
jgi:hypothetical protein